MPLNKLVHKKNQPKKKPTPIKASALNQKELAQLNKKKKPTPLKSATMSEIRTVRGKLPNKNSRISSKMAASFLAGPKAAANQLAKQTGATNAYAAAKNKPRPAIKAAKKALAPKKKPTALQASPSQRAKLAKAAKNAAAPSTRLQGAAAKYMTPKPKAVVGKSGSRAQSFKPSSRRKAPTVGGSKPTGAKTKSRGRLGRR